MIAFLRVPSWRHGRRDKSAGAAPARLESAFRAVIEAGLTANSLWNQCFGEITGGRQAPLLLASGSVIDYPERSAAAGIRSIRIGSKA